MGLLDKVQGPEDIRMLSYTELDLLALEIRDRIIETVRKNGGHLASNLGIVELTLALHRVYKTPLDTIIWDVGHQCYTHKLITGRNAAFPGLRKSTGISGFPKRSESPHDAFDTGHASTSISTALGILHAHALLGDSGSVVAVIGDGALTGGMAFEALNHAGQTQLPLVVVLNDNRMSISPVVGALSRYLSRLSATAHYQSFRMRVDRGVRAIPRAGPKLFALMLRLKRSVKAFFYKENLFSDLGFEYIGPLDGHDVAGLEAVLSDVKKLGHPAVVHVITTKGRGHADAEVDPASYHGVAPAPVSIPVRRIPVPASCPDDPGTPLPQGKPGITFTEQFQNSMLSLGAECCTLVAITAAMSKGTGLDPFHSRFPERFHDVGIAEQHAVTLAAGMASGGLVPVVALYATFLQRAIDQLFHDVALQGLHVVFAVDRAGLVPDDGETHQGIYDLSMIRQIPGMTILAPASGEDLDLCLRWAVRTTGPVLLRYPKARTPSRIEGCELPVEKGRGCFVQTTARSPLLVLAAGSTVATSLEALERARTKGIIADLVSLRFLAPVDSEWIRATCAPYSGILIVEENVAAGGIGEALLPLLLSDGMRTVRTMAVAPRYYPQGSRDELLSLAGISIEDIEREIACLHELASPLQSSLHSPLPGTGSLSPTLEEARPGEAWPGDARSVDSRAAAVRSSAARKTGQSEGVA